MENDSQQPLNTNFTPPGLNASGQQFHPGNSDLKPKKSKKKVFLTLLLVLLLVGSAAATYFFFFKKDATAPSAPAAQVQEQKPTGPVSLVYSNSSDATAADYSLKLSSLTLTDNKKTDFDTEDKSQLSYSAIHEQEIVAVGVPSSEQQKTQKIFYSKDSGVTYVQIYETKESGQITGVDFSSDGSTIIFGLLPTESGKNTLTELNPETKATTDIFTTDAAGINIYGYTKGKQIIYRKGCFNCDGTPESKIYSYDIATKKESVIVSSSNTIGNLAVKNDLSSLLYVDVPTKPATDGLGDITTGPSTIKSLDLATNKTTDLKSLGQAGTDLTIQLGYTTNGNPYFTDNNIIYGASASNEISTLFTSTKIILDVHYVGLTEAYTSLGGHDAFTVEKFNVSDQKSTSLFDGKSSTTIVGITTND